MKSPNSADWSEMIDAGARIEYVLSDIFISVLCYSKLACHWECAHFLI